MTGTCTHVKPPMRCLACESSPDSAGPARPTTYAFVAEHARNDVIAGKRNVGFNRHDIAILLAKELDIPFKYEMRTLAFSTKKDTLLLLLDRVLALKEKIGGDQ